MGIIERLHALYGPQLRWEDDSIGLVTATVAENGYSDAAIDEAVDRLSSKHQDFPPSPAAVLGTLKEIRRDEARYPELPALPAPEPAAGSLRSHLVRLYGEEGKTITWNEHIQRWHASKNPDGCGGRFCDVCGDPDPEDLRALTSMSITGGIR